MFRATIATLILTFCCLSVSAQEEVFSGPQVGEKLPEFSAKYLKGKLVGDEFKVVKSAGDKPLFVIFWNELDRPGFGLIRTLTQYTAEKADKLQTVIVCLDDDPEAAKFKRTFQLLNAKSTIALATGGSEGPGSYGLNRNVRLTILVGKEGKVVANYALIQPSVQADAPKILKSLATAIGEKEADVDRLLDSMSQKMQMRRRGSEQMQREGADRPKASTPARGGDRKLDGMLRQVISKDASDDDVRKAAEAIAEYVDKNERAKQDLARRAKRIVESGKLSNYGTATAQEVIKGWAKKYVEKEGDSEKESSGEK